MHCGRALRKHYRIAYQHTWPLVARGYLYAPRTNPRTSRQLQMSVDITNVSLEEITPLVKNYCDRGSLEGMGMWGIGVTLTGLIRSCHSESRDFELKPK